MIKIETLIRGKNDKFVPAVDGLRDESINNVSICRLVVLIGRLAKFDSEIRSEIDEQLSFESSLVKLELQSVEFAFVTSSSNPKPSKIKSNGMAAFTFCR